jgi:excisionase family DNA binding protein
MAKIRTKMKVYTTGEIAKICGVAPRTVSKWFDSGRLKGYRIPGSKDRRVTVADLDAFARENNLPVSPLVARASKVLAVGFARPERLRDVDYDVVFAANLFEAGLLFAEDPPVCVVVDKLIGALDARVVASEARAKGVPCVAVDSEPDDRFDDVVPFGWTADALTEVVYDVVNRMPTGRKAS